MPKFEETTENPVKQEEIENIKTPVNLEKSSEELGEQITEQSTKEVVDFQDEGEKELNQIEAQAEKDGLDVDTADKEELLELNKEAITAKEDLNAEISGGVGAKDLMELQVKDVEETGLITCLEETYEFIKDPRKFLRDSEEQEIIGKFVSSVNENSKIISEFLENDKTALQMAEVLRHSLITENEKKQQRESKCRMCGSELSPTANFCKDCGNEIRVQNFVKFESIFDGLVDSLDMLDAKLEKLSSEEDSDDKTRLRNNIFYAVSEVLNSSNVSNRIKASLWFKKHGGEIDEIKKIHDTKEDGRTISSDHIGEYTMDNVISRTESLPLMKEYLRAYMKKNNDKEASFDVDRLLDKEYTGNLRDRKREISKVIVEEFGLGDEIIKKWDKAKFISKKIGDEDVKDIESYAFNIKALQALEKIMPGSGKTLYDNFGIANFARYEKETLFRQLEMQEENVPYGAVVFPEADWNGAFFNDSHLLEEVRKQLLKGGYEMRIMEAGTQFEMARRLNRFHQKYEPAGHKMSYMLLGGHGTRTTIQLGINERSLPEIDTEAPPLPEEFKSELEYENAFDKWRKNLKDNIDKKEISSLDPRHTILAHDLKENGGSGIRRASQKWFDEEASMVLISCSTGAEGGIAQRIGGELGFTTTGPDRPTNVDKINVNFDQKGKPVFEVKYSESPEYGKTETMNYVSGKKVE